MMSDRTALDLHDRLDAQDPPDGPAHAWINRWTATFGDKAVESEYRAQFAPEWRRVNVISIAVLSGFMLLVHISDTVRTGWTADTLTMGAIRLATLLTGAFAAFMIWRRRVAPDADWIVFGFLMVFYGAFTALTAMRELDPLRDDPLTYQVLGIALILASYMFFSMRFPLLVIAGVIATAAYNAGSLLSPWLPDPDTSIAFALQAFGNGLLAFAVYRLQMLRRHQFAAFLAERELRVALAQSRLELLAAARSLEQARDEAVSATQVKSDFLAQISHELRSPLNAIIGFTDVIRSRTFGPADFGRYESYVGDIGGSAAHLLAVINDLLDLSKIEAGRFELEQAEFPLSDAIDGAARMVRERAVSGQIELQLPAAEADIVLLADERILRQVLINLLTNAVKFTPPGGLVSVKLMRQPAGGIVITVADTGPGIARAELPKVMELYGRADRSRRLHAEGTGLGLPMARMMMELHGGTLSIESAPGEGTAIHLGLPADRIKTPAGGAEPAA